MAGRRVSNALYGADEQVDFTDIKGAVEAILEPFYFQEVGFRAEELPSYLDARQAASVYVSGSRIGSLGRLNSQVAEQFDIKRTVYLFEGDFDKLFSLRQPHPLFKSLPKFPAVARDMAIILEEGVPSREAMDIIRRQHEPLLEHTEIFDIYRNPQLGAGKKSIGYRLVYRAPDRSLTDEEVNEVHSRLTAEVLRSLNAALR
jgi:phenylalanyl-tRNA synthetase beta chain